MIDILIDTVVCSDSLNYGRDSWISNESLNHCHSQWYPEWKCNAPLQSRNDPNVHNPQGAEMRSIW